MLRTLLILVFALLANVFCYANTQIEGDWSFISIKNDTKKIDLPISKSDSIHFDTQNKTFFYNLEAKNNLVAKGSWSIEDNNTMKFVYTHPKDTVRVYKMVEAGNVFKLIEDGTVYKFRKKTGLVSLETEDSSFGINLLKGFLGILVLIGIAFGASSNRKAIDWKLVIKGIVIQFVFAVLVIKIPQVATLFDVLSKFFVTVINFTHEGTAFLFNSFVTGNLEVPLINFAIKVLPTIIFFSALSSLLYYWGILQKIVFALAWIMKKAMGLSGAESLSAAGNIFLGQTESPFLVKPYIAGMTKSETMCLMVGGMATIAGGVLAAYIGFLGGGDPEAEVFFAKHLLAASVMSAPAAIVAAKILVPETEGINEVMEISKENIGANALEAVSNGTSDGIKLAVNVGAMLLVFTALMALGNYVLGDVIGHYSGLNDIIVMNTPFDKLSFQMILGYIGAPIAWLVGVPADDVLLVGQLLGEKTILNEFYAYKTLGGMKDSAAFNYERSIIIATYVLCGFANFASIGIQIGGIGVLAPNKKAMLSKLGVKALIGGTLACLFTAAIVGILI
mgnify:CR=1 FL=1